VESAVENVGMEDVIKVERLEEENEQDIPKEALGLSVMVGFAVLIKRPMSKLGSSI
jgi:hypothetical protein